MIRRHIAQPLFDAFKMDNFRYPLEHDICRTHVELCVLHWLGDTMNVMRTGLVGVALFTLGGIAMAQSPTSPAPQAAPSPAPQAPASSVDPSNKQLPNDTTVAVDAQAEPAPSPPAADPAATSQTAEWEGAVPEAPTDLRMRISGSAVDLWMANPRTLLDDHREGGRIMAQFTRSLINTDNRTLPALVSLVKMPDVRDAQVGAVAEGMASSVRDTEVAAPQYAAYIQWNVAQSGSKELIEAFERSMGREEDLTAAIGGAGGAGGPAGSGSLSGTGTLGTSGPVGGDSTVSNGNPSSAGSRGGRGFSLAGDELLNGSSGRLALCTIDTSPVGCQLAF